MASAVAILLTILVTTGGDMGSGIQAKGWGVRCRESVERVFPDPQRRIHVSACLESFIAFSPFVTSTPTNYSSHAIGPTIPESEEFVKTRTIIKDMVSHSNYCCRKYSSDGPCIVFTAIQNAAVN